MNLVESISFVAEKSSIIKKNRNLRSIKLQHVKTRHFLYLGIKVLLVVGMYGVGCLAGHVGAESLTSIWALLLGTDLRGAQKAS